MSKKTSESLRIDSEAVDSLMVRFAAGFFRISELCELKQVSKSQFYLDASSGLVTIEKFGKLSRVPGWSAARYLGIKEFINRQDQD
jgi:hypothetical protein